MRSSVLRSDKRTGARGGSAKAATRGLSMEPRGGTRRPTTRDRLEQSFLGKREEHGGLSGVSRSWTMREQLKSQFASPGTAFQHAAQGPSRELPFRAEMERMFGQTFKDVKAHFGSREALEGLAGLGANAATQGNTIVFASASPTKEVIAHELAHVVQNRNKGTGSGCPTSATSQRGDATEREAETIARRAGMGQPVEVQQLGGAQIHMDQVDPAFRAEEKAQEMVKLSSNHANADDRIKEATMWLSQLEVVKAEEKHKSMVRFLQLLGLHIVDMKHQTDGYVIITGQKAYKILNGSAVVLCGKPDGKGSFFWTQI